jgi:hypothetical protein
MTAAGLSDEQRNVLAAIADVLIPHTDSMPAASEVQLHGRWIDKALAARPDLVEPTVTFLDRAAAVEPGQAIETFSRESPEAFEDFLLLVTCSYYMNPKVRKRLGYPGQKARPPYPDESEYYLRDGLLDPVIERGPIYVAAD